jgi:hypothetical protein
VPADLSAKPTLSVVTDSAVAATATVQLSYLSQGFDWSANYVARLSADGKTLDLFAWMTITNGGSQGFSDAHTQAVAGAPNREANAALPKGPPPELRLQCWPMDITSTHARWNIDRPAPPEPSSEVAAESYEDIVVTAQRRRQGLYDAPVAVTVAMTAKLEELGDLKLYRIPERVTVAAKSSKQVAMIDQPKIRFERIHRGAFEDFDYDKDDEPESAPAEVVLRTENRATNGLGLPLPAGGVALFEPVDGAPILVAESRLADRAVGDEVEIGAGQSPDLRYTVVARPGSERRKPYRVRVTNARATPELFELEIPYKVSSSSEKLIERKGVKTWRVTVPANGEAKLDFALKLEPES